MDNLSIESIGDFNKVTALFKELGCYEDNNCILVVVNRDFIGGTNTGALLATNSTVVGAKHGGVAGGLAGGLVAGAINSMVSEATNEFNKKLDEKQKVVFNTNMFSGFLINVISGGIGIIPLRNDGQIVPKVKDFKTVVESFCFISNDEIKSKQIKKLPLNFSSRKIAIQFENTGSVETPWQVPMKHKLVPYQEENFNKLTKLLS